MFKPYRFCLASLFACLLFLTGCGENNNSMRANAATSQTDRNDGTEEINDTDIVILSQPQSLSLPENKSFSLSIEAHSESSLRYQWYKNDQAIIGATDDTYSKSQGALTDTGIYHVIVRNEYTQRRSLSAHISISSLNNNLTIIHQPQSQTISAGDALFLNVEVEGAGPFKYQWQKNGSLIPNATTSHYYVAQSQKADEASYRVIISNQNGFIYSNFVNVWVNEAIAPVSINRHPQSQLILENSSTVLSVSASGGGFLTYQWRKNGEPINNAYSATLSLSGLKESDAGFYDVVVANSQGSKISEIAYLDVLSADQTVDIMQQPLSQYITPGQSFSLSVSAAADSPLSYQWFLNDKLIPGADSASYNVLQAGTMDVGSYSVVVSDAYSSERSQPAMISLYVPDTYAIELSWDTPRTREDGSPLDASEILEYVIEYGYEENALKWRAIVPHQVVNSHILDDIYPGKLFLRIATVDSDGYQGTFSETISLFID